MMKTINNVMKRFIVVVCAVALCSGCTHFSNGEIECYEVEAFNHDYVVFENPKSGSITAVYSEDCQCKNNKYNELWKGTITERACVKML